MATKEIDCSIIRGGTSKGIFVNGADLPTDVAERDRLLLALFGSPDIRQIDGLGGADPLTSKLAVVTRSSRPGVDVEFEAAQIGIAKPIVDFSLMCGNTASGVGYFAIVEGMVAPVEPFTVVNILCRNNDKIITATVPVKDSRPVSEGDFVIHGVTRPGCEELMEFKEPGGAVTGALLPTGSVRDRVDCGGDPITVSVVDSGTLYCFVSASEMGIGGHEPPAVLDGDADFRSRIESLRHAVADHVNAAGIAGNKTVAARNVKIATVAPPSDYGTMNGNSVSGTDYDIAARIINPEKTHKAFAVSGAICLASACALENGVAGDVFRAIESPATVRIGHPSGVMDARVSFERSQADPRILSAEVKRTARILMRGTAYVVL